MDWRRSLLQFNAERSADGPSLDFRPGASAAAVAAAEQRVGVRFPPSLRSLLQQTNGVMEQMQIGGALENIHWLFWPVDQLVKENESHRTIAAEHHMGPANAVLFFADAGADGISFGFPVKENGKCRPRVVVWHPIGDTVTEVAPTLEDFFRRWGNGELRV